MKQFFTLLLLTVFIAGVQAQIKRNTSYRTPDLKPINSDNFTEINQKSVKATGDTIWYEDFSDSASVATNFTFHDSTGQNFNWLCVDAGLSGAAYTSAGEMTIASPSGTNGYMLLPSDWYNSDHNGNMISQTNMRAWFQTPAINCTGKNSVIVRLYERFRYCCSPSTMYAKLQVSTNGTTWTDFDISNGTLVNTATANPKMFEFNITPIAANQATVYLRVCFGGASHYFACVDDILLYEGAPYDLRLDRTLPSFFFLGDLPVFSKVPMTLLNCDQAYGLIYAGKLYNMGDSPNTPTLSASARNLSDNAIDYTTTTTALSSGNTEIAAGVIDTAYADETFYPTRKGDYRLIFDFQSSGSDYTPDNNKDSSLTLNVNDTTLALYRSTLSTTKGYSVAGERTPLQAVDGDIIAQYLYLPCGDTVSSISFYPLRKVNYMSDMPIIAFAVLYQYVGNAWTLVDESAPLDLTSSTQFNKWQTCYFSSDLVLEAGNYLWGIAVYSGALYISIDASSYQPKATNFIYMADEAQWYYTTDGTCGMNLNFLRSDVQGVEENALSDLNINCYPNPANTIANFEFELKENANVAVQIMDVTGKEIMNYSKENMSTGVQTISFDVRNLTSGMYFYTMVVDGQKTTGKLNIVK